MTAHATNYRILAESATFRKRCPFLDYKGREQQLRSVRHASFCKAAPCNACSNALIAEQRRPPARAFQKCLGNLTGAIIDAALRVGMKMQFDEVLRMVAVSLPSGRRSQIIH